MLHSDVYLAFLGMYQFLQTQYKALVQRESPLVLRMPSSEHLDLESNSQSEHVKGRLDQNAEDMRRMSSLMILNIEWPKNPTDIQA
jgi:hypothetical protein